MTFYSPKLSDWDISLFLKESQTDFNIQWGNTQLTFDKNRETLILFGVNMKKNLSINGMTCQHCVKHTKEALESVQGVTSVVVSLEGKSAIIECSDSVSDNDLKEAVAEAGYEVTGIE